MGFQTWVSVDSNTKIFQMQSKFKLISRESKKENVI